MTCSVFLMLELHFGVLILCRIKDSTIIYDGILNGNVVLGIFTENHKFQMLNVILPSTKFRSTCCLFSNQIAIKIISVDSNPLFKDVSNIEQTHYNVYLLNHYLIHN